MEALAGLAHFEAYVLDVWTDIFPLGLHEHVHVPFSFSWKRTWLVGLGHSLFEVLSPNTFPLRGTGFHSKSLVQRCNAATII